jgi:hypothetical protein
LIIAADGTKLAVNRSETTSDGRHVYERRYPTNKMFAHVVGYSSATDGRAGVERSANDYLVGAHTDLGGALSSELHSLAGGEVVGDDVQLSLLPSAQRKAMSDLAATGKSGAVFALAPRGRASTPTRQCRARCPRPAAHSSTARRRASTRPARRSSP